MPWELMVIPVTLPPEMVAEAVALVLVEVTLKL